MSIFPQLCRYTIVSALALFTDIALYLQMIHFGIRPVLAGAVGYAIGVMLHFVLSCWKVFDATRTGKSSMRLFSEFLLSGIVGLALTTSLIWIITEIMKQDAVTAKMVAVGVSFFAVFMLRRSVVFAVAGRTEFDRGNANCGRRRVRF
jgi:putative flippase GtrA